MSGSVLTDNSGHYVYAGFWWRVLASILDTIVSSIFVFVLAAGLFFFLVAGDLINQRQVDSVADALGFPIGILVTALYYVIFECSRLRATPGKMICGLKVVDENGNQLNFGRALGRYLGKIVSGLILGIGFMMAGWTRRKQALHDMMSGCLVVRRRVEAVRIAIDNA